MSGTTVVALILAIPTYGISLALLLAYKFYQAGRSVNSIEKVLVHLGNEGTGQGTCIREISYLQARTFLEEKGEHVESVNSLHRYLLKLSDGVLLVDVNQEPTGAGAIFRVQRIDWLLDLQRWARAGNMPKKGISLADLYKLEIFEDDPLDDIGNSQLSRPVEALPANFHKLPYLKKLFINGKALASLGSNIAKMQSLEVLKVSHAEAIPPEVCELENLIGLQFAWGQVAEVPEGIGRLKKLKYLELQENRIASIPESVGSLPELQILDLSKNRLSSLPETVTANRKLFDLKVSDNRLSHLPSFPKVPDWSNEIHSIDLGFNQFDAIPASIFDLDYIDQLILCGNTLKSLPEKVSLLKVEYHLVLGQQQQLRLTQKQISGLKQLEADGCEIWLECEDLVLGQIDKWKGNIDLRFYSTIGDSF